LVFFNHFVLFYNKILTESFEWTHHIHKYFKEREKKKEEKMVKICKYKENRFGH